MAQSTSQVLNELNLRLTGGKQTKPKQTKNLEISPNWGEINWQIYNNF